jgi:hypothetical protein
MFQPYQPGAPLLASLGFTAYSSPPRQARYSRPSACGQETIVLYEEGELALLESINSQLLYSFRGRIASEAELQVLLRQVNWAPEPFVCP